MFNAPRSVADADQKQQLSAFVKISGQEFLARYSPILEQIRLENHMAQCRFRGRLEGLEETLRIEVKRLWVQKRHALARSRHKQLRRKLFKRKMPYSFYIDQFKSESRRFELFLSSVMYGDAWRLDMWELTKLSRHFEAERKKAADQAKAVFPYLGFRDIYYDLQKCWECASKDSSTELYIPVKYLDFFSEYKNYQRNRNL